MNARANRNNQVGRFISLLLALSVGGCQAQSESRREPKAEVLATRSALIEAEPQVPAESTAQFFGLSGMAALSSTGINGDLETVTFKKLVTTDTRNHTVRLIDPITGLVTTLAGTAGVAGSTGLLLRNPTGVAIGRWYPEVDQELFVADTGNHTIRHVYIRRAGLLADGSYYSVEHNADTVAGVAGQRGYGSGASALFDSPQGVAIESLSDQSEELWTVGSILVADTGNAVIRRVDLETHQVSLVAGVPGQHGFADDVAAMAKFNRPTSLVLANEKLYVADTGNHVVRVVDLASPGAPVTTLAGMPGVYGHHDGPGLEAQFAQPVGLAMLIPNRLLVADRASYTIRSIDLGPGAPVSTIAGVAWARGSVDGNGASARLRAPSGVAALGTDIYVADTGNNLVRTIRPQDADVFVGTLTGIRGPGSSDGWPEQFSLGKPNRLACDGGRLFVSSTSLMEVQLDPNAEAGVARILAGGSSSFAVGGSPDQWPGLTYGANGLYRRLGYSVDRLDLLTGQHRTVAPAGEGEKIGCLVVSPLHAFVGVGQSTGVGSAEFLLRYSNNFANTIPQVLGAGLIGTLAVWEESDAVYSRAPFGFRKTTDLAAGSLTHTDFTVGLSGDEPLAIAAHGDFVYFTTDAPPEHPYRHTVRRAQLSSGAVTVLAGSVDSQDGPFKNPAGLCVSGTNLFVADTDHAVIQKVSLETGAVVPVALRRAQ